jgi:hypothetical protein
MSSRALASQRNKRSVQPQPPRPPPQQQPAKSSPSQPSNATSSSSQNNKSTNRELSIPEAFSILNNRVSNLEKKIFDGQDTIISNTPDTPLSSNNKQQMIDDIKKEINFDVNNDVLNDYNYRIRQLEENSSNNIVNPFKQITNHVSEEEFNLLKVANNESNHKIKTLEDLTNTLNTNIDHLKDTIINLQNFTLEINNTFLQHMNSEQTNPLSFLDNLSNQANVHSISDSDSELNDNYSHGPGIQIDVDDNRSISPDEVVIVPDTTDNDLFHEPDDILLTDITNNLEETELLIPPMNTPNSSDNSDNVSITSKDNKEIVNDETEIVNDETEIVNDETEIVNDETEIVNDETEIVNDDGSNNNI